MPLKVFNQAEEDAKARMQATRTPWMSGIRRRNNDDLIGYDEISGGVKAAIDYGNQLASKVVEGAGRKLREAPRAGEVALDPSGKAYDGGGGTKVYKGKGKHGETVYSDSGYDPLMYGKETSAETKKFLAENPAIAANFARDRAPGAKRMDDRLAAVREQMNTPKMTMDDFLKQAQTENTRVRSKLALADAGLKGAQSAEAAHKAAVDEAESAYTELRKNLSPEEAAIQMARRGIDPRLSLGFQGDSSAAVSGLVKGMSEDNYPLFSAAHNWATQGGFMRPRTDIPADARAALSLDKFDSRVGKPGIGSAYDEYVYTIPGLGTEDFAPPTMYSQDASMMDRIANAKSLAEMLKAMDAQR